LAWVLRGLRLVPLARSAHMKEAEIVRLTAFHEQLSSA